MMNQEEFEKGLRELKEQRNTALSGIDYLLGDVRQRRALLQREYEALQSRRTMLTVERLGLERQRGELSRKWSLKIQAYIEENGTTARKLEEVSDWCIINELRHRGFKGQLENEGKENTFLENLNAKLNGKESTPPTSLDTEQQHEEGSVA